MPVHRRRGLDRDGVSAARAPHAGDERAPCAPSALSPPGVSYPLAVAELDLDAMVDVVARASDSRFLSDAARQQLRRPLEVARGGVVARAAEVLPVLAEAACAEDPRHWDSG